MDSMVKNHSLYSIRLFSRVSFVLLLKMGFLLASVMKTISSFGHCATNTDSLTGKQTF